MTVPLISIVGKSNSGKTTLVEKLIPELIKEGIASPFHQAQQARL